MFLVIDQTAHSPLLILLIWEIIRDSITVQQLQLSHPLSNSTLNANALQVDIGILHELWDKPSAEVRCREQWSELKKKWNEQVTLLKTQCDSLLEKHEDDMEDWYFEKQDEVKSSSIGTSLKNLTPGVVRGICLQTKGS